MQYLLNYSSVSRKNVQSWIFNKSMSWFHRVNVISQLYGLPNSFTVMEESPWDKDNWKKTVKNLECERSRDYVVGLLYTLKICLAGGLSSHYARLIAIASLTCFFKLKKKIFLKFWIPPTASPLSPWPHTLPLQYPLTFP